MRKFYLLLTVLFLIINSNIYSQEIPLISTSELKVCSGNYNDGSKEFTGTYVEGVKDGKYQEWRVGVWKFWYPNGKIKFEGLYKDGTLVSKKCWDKNGKSIGCDLLEMSDSERYRILKEI